MAIFVIITCFSLLLANPHVKESQSKVIKDGIDIAIVFDLSYSMMAEDISPNRLEVAKEVLSDFVGTLKTDRVGFILFSWKPFTSVPLTFDYDFVSKFISKLSIKTINQDYTHLQWTAIWDALLYGANLFEKDSKREKVIVLLTDGEANKWMRPIDAVRYIKEKNIKVHTVWIWGREDTYVKVKSLYWEQKIAIGWIDENNLKAIASLTNGIYYRAENNKTFKQIFEKLNLLPKKEIEIDEYELQVPYYKPFSYVLFVVLSVFIFWNMYYYLRRPYVID